MKREFNIFYLAVVYIGMGITSCQNVDNLPNYQIFNYNDDAGITTLDPALARSQSEIWAVSQLYNSLIDLDQSLKPMPSLAKKWTVENGGKRIKFHLRKNIRFCIESSNSLWKDSTKILLRANDVVASLRRVANPTLGSPGLWIFTNLDTTHQHGIYALNDSTVVLELLKPQASMVSLMATSYCAILPEALCKREKAFVAQHPVGTGPFYLKRWEREVKMVLRKNPQYFEQDSLGNRLPYLDAVAVTFIKNKQTAFMQFVAGKFDFFNGLEGSFKDELLTDSATLKPKYQSRFKLLVTPFLNTEYIGMYIDSLKPGHVILRNRDFREALSLAIPRADLVRFVRNGLGDPAYDGFVPSILLAHHPGHLPNFSSHQARAIQIIQQWKQTHGKLPELTLTTNADYLDMAVFLQKAWSDIGVKVNIDLQTSAMLRQKRNEGSLQLFRGSWIADYPDAESYLACFYGPFCSPFGPNYTHFVSHEFDGLYQQIESGVGGGDVRDANIAQANALISREHPVIPLYYDKSLRLIQPWVEGLNNDAINRLILKRVQIKHSPQ